MDDIKRIIKNTEKKIVKNPKPEEKVDRFPTGYLQLDIVLGGGLPRNKITEISGAPACGKTLLSYEIIAKAQAEGQIVLLIAGDAVNRHFLQKKGVNIEDLIIFDPSSAESVFEVLDAFTSKNSVDLVVIDSMASLPNYSDYNEAFVSIDALIADVVKICDERKVTTLCLNQVRHGKLLNKKSKGEAITVSAFEAIMDYFCAVRIRLEQKSTIKKDDVLIGKWIEADIHKNIYNENDIKPMINLSI